MKRANPKIRVSEYFELGRDQTTLDFVDVPIGNDITVFLDPSRIRSMETTWAMECNSLLQHFFERLLDYIKLAEPEAGLAMLEGLSERNEFHLGFSRGLSQGSGIGREFAQAFWAALSKSKASKTGLLKDLEDACLFIDGVGPDRISDAACNILRGPLIKYTQDMCKYYGIPLQKNIDSGLVWNPTRAIWEDSLIELPVTPFGALLLVPKIAVRHRLAYDSQRYFRHYLLPRMQAHEKAINSSLVKVLKDGTRIVTKAALCAKYGADKLTIADETLKHSGVLDQYRRTAKRTSQPLTHNEFAELENIAAPEFHKLLSDVVNTPVGLKAAPEYENSIEALLSALFFPSLSAPTKQNEIHEGRKRIDITYVNSAQSGFFYWVAMHYPAGHIFVECKNYSQDVGNPELDQLAGRFSPSRGKVGMLVCRSANDDVRLTKRVIDTASDQRGFILHLTDADLITLVEDYVQSNGNTNYPLLQKKFNKLIM